MNYAQQSKINMPIGSGVVEAACKELVKHRLVGSGMRWNNNGAAIVISIRSLILSTAARSPPPCSEQDSPAPANPTNQSNSAGTSNSQKPIRNSISPAIGKS